MCGSYGYIAPEVWWGEKSNAKADLFSLGITLYVLCNGRLPWDKDNN